MLGMHGMVCMTLCDPMDCSLLGSSVHGMLGMFCQNLKELGKKKKDRQIIPDNRKSRQAVLCLVTQSCPTFL